MRAAMGWLVAVAPVLLVATMWWLVLRDRGGGRRPRD